MKQFAPPLHTTLMKLAVDPSRPLRLKTAQVLARMSPIHHRLEQLHNDLMTALKTQADASVRETTLYALRLFVGAMGDKLHATPMRKQLVHCCLTSVGFAQTLAAPASPPFTVPMDDASRVQMAACIGALVATFPSTVADDDKEFSALLNFILPGISFIRSFKVIISKFSYFMLIKAIKTHFFLERQKLHIAIVFNGYYLVIGLNYLHLVYSKV